jgi:hypothetical protein
MGAVPSLPSMGNLTATLGQLTQLAEGNTGMFASSGDADAYGKDGAKGGNVEFVWKVEEDENSGEVFSLTAMEETASGISNELESVIAQVDSTAEAKFKFGTVFTTKIDWSESGEQDTGDVFDVTAVDTSAAASDRQFQSFVVEFDRPIDPVASGGGVFDFKAMEESEAAQVKIKTYICPSDAVSLNGDGMDDLATYLQIDPASDGTSLPNLPVVDLQLDHHFETLV